MGNKKKPVIHKNKKDTIKSSEKKVNRYITYFSAAALLFAFYFLWSAPKSIGDLFIALAGGRDAISGHIGTPDDWSFTTAGCVWINQNWGTDVIFYISYKLLGETGLLLLKALMIISSGIFTVLALLKRKLPANVSLSVTAVIMISMLSYVDLRPNLMTLVMAPLVLWLLYRTKEHPRQIWFIVPVMLVWANSHGGFIFGLGMMCLWAVCLALPSLMLEGFKSILRFRNYFAASAIAIILAALVNPFGPINLTFPFLMVNSGIWLTVNEWTPIWNTNVGFGGIWEFIVIICVMIFLLIIQLFHMAIDSFEKRRRPSENKSLWSNNNISMIIFDSVVIVVSVAMAVTSRRFIPLALIMTVPVIASQIWWLVRSIRIQWLIAGVSLASLVISLFILQSVLQFYSAVNPFSNTGSFFEKMHYVNKNFSPELSDFINDNNINSEVFCSWDWEGFLRWNSPGIKVFTGGRAQQVYSADTYEQYGEIAFSQSHLDAIRRNNIHMIVIPYRSSFQDLVKSVLSSGNWVMIYNDGKSFILVDSAWPSNSDIIERFSNNRLVYTDHNIEMMSKAAFMLSSYSKADKQEIFQKFKDALILRPQWLWGYGNLFDRFLNDSEMQKQMEEFLKQQIEQLDSMSIDKPEGEAVLLSRINVADALFYLYQNLRMKTQTNKIVEYSIVQKDLYSQMMKKWSRKVPTSDD